MAIALVSGSRGSTVTLTGGFNPTIDLPAGGSIAVGNTLIMVAAYDNSGTAGVDPNLWIVNSTVAATQAYGIDLRGNLWWRIAKVVRNGGVANDGNVADIWACLVTNAYTNGDDITLQFSFSVANLAVQIIEYSGVNARSYSVVPAILGSGIGTTIGPAGTITPLAVGQLVIGVAAVETNTAITGDGDTTGGAWVTAANQVANSGVDTTSQTLFVQTKIVTTTAAQDWDVTKTGASDWVALAVVFEAFTSVANGFLSGNPNYPCIAGAEVLPLNFDYLPVDTGTEYLQRHRVFPNSYGSNQYQAASFLVYNPQGSAASFSHHTTIHDLYLDGADTVQDEIFTQHLAVVGAGVGGGASVSSGTAADALVRIGGAYVTLPNAGYVDVLFDPAALTTYFFNYRIVRWGIQYLAWKDDGAAPGPGEGMIAEWRDGGANNGAGSAASVSAWLVQNYQRDAQFETRWIGEVNPIIRGKDEILSQNVPYNAAFTVNDLSHMALVDQSTRLRLYGAQGSDPSQSTVYLDYVQAVVELVPERRLAHGTRLSSTAPGFGSTAAYSDQLGSTQMWSALNTNNEWQIPAAADTYVLATREPMAASPGDYWAAQVATAAGSIPRTVGFNESIGPSFLMRVVEQPRATLENVAQTGQPELRRGTLDGGVLAAPPEEADNFIISVATLDLIRFNLDGSFYPGYDFGGVAGDSSEIYTGHSIPTNVLVDGATTFDRVKVLVYPDELTTANLTITVEKPSLTVLATATITVAQALAFPDIGNGWREISVALNVSVTPTSGQAVIRFASTTASTAPWRVALANPMRSLDQYGYNYGQNQADYAAVLQCLLAAPSVVLETTSQDMYRPDGRCLDDEIMLPILTIPEGFNYDWVSIERSVDASTTWRPVVLLEGPFDDGVVDIFARTVVDGWGSADTGQAWTITSGPAADFDVAAGVGTMNCATAGDQFKQAHLDTSSPDQDLYVDVAWVSANAGSQVAAIIEARQTDASNYYSATITWGTANDYEASLQKVVAGATTTLASVVAAGAPVSAGSFLRVRLQTIGTTIRVKVWLAASTEPAAWMASVTDTSLATGNQASLVFFKPTANTSASKIAQWDNFSVNNAINYTDTAVPWDLPAGTVTYRVTGYRNADHLTDVTITSGWGDTATAPGVAFGLAAPSGLLYAYLPTSESALDITWNPLNPTEIVPLLGVDYQIPLRAPEERGLAVSFLVVVDQLLVCGDVDAVPWDEFLPTSGAMSPTPFEQLRELAKTQRFSLLLEGGHSRFVTMTLGGLTIKTQIGLYLAEVTLTDVTIPEVDPYS